MRTTEPRIFGHHEGGIYAVWKKKLIIEGAVTLISRLFPPPTPRDKALATVTTCPLSRGRFRPTALPALSPDRGPWQAL